MIAQKIALYGKWFCVLLMYAAFPIATIDIRSADLLMGFGTGSALALGIIDVGLYYDTR